MCLFWAHEKKGMSMHIKYVQWEVTYFVGQNLLLILSLSDIQYGLIRFFNF